MVPSSGADGKSKRVPCKRTLSFLPPPASPEGGAPSSAATARARHLLQGEKQQEQVEEEVKEWLRR